jgi:hypothetical protein
MRIKPLLLLLFGICKIGQFLGACLLPYISSRLHFFKSTANSRSNPFELPDRAADLGQFGFQQFTDLSASISWRSRRSNSRLISCSENPTPCICLINVKRETSSAVYNRNRPAVRGTLGNSALRSYKRIASILSAVSFAASPIWIVPATTTES